MRRIARVYAVIFCGFASAVWAQESYRCGTYEYMERLKAEDPQVEHGMQAAEEQIQDNILRNASRKSTAVVTIPVVVHVVYETPVENISDAQILSEIDVLNEEFRRQHADTSDTPAEFKSLAADPQFEFCLASFDPFGNTTTGIDRKATTQANFTMDDKVKSSITGGANPWPADRYLNIWVCDLALPTLGYATFPGSNPGLDGIVVGYKYFGRVGTLQIPYTKGRTSVHEIGHWLGLKHIWGDDGGACTGSDDVSDTPDQADNYSGCPSYPQNSCGTSNMFMNYMDYVTDGCMNLFTLGQAVRMTATIDGTRASIKSSTGCGPTLVPEEHGQDKWEVTLAPSVSTDGRFVLTILPGEPDRTYLYVYDIYGKEILHKDIGTPSGRYFADADLSSAPSGIYMVVLRNEKETVSTVKAVVARMRN